MKQIIETIAKALVDVPEAVTITQIGEGYTSILELKVAKEDIGKIIGKQGRTANAIRVILNGISAKSKKRTVLEIMDDPKKTAAAERWQP